MNDATAPDVPLQQFQCSFCRKDFRRESTLLAHICEAKRRNHERNEMGVQLGLQAYLRFYEVVQGSSRLRSWGDFAQSSYYRAFVKFGRHCQQIRAVNYAAFLDWLISNNKKLDNWCSDKLYEEYLVQHVKSESAMDALCRALESSLEWGSRTGNHEKDYLRYGNDNVICHDICRGRVTAWSIYNCTSGREFLSRINSEQIAMIWSWIDSDYWQRRFQDYVADQVYVQQMLQQAGW